MVVDKRHYTKQEHAFLRNQSAIRLGPCSFYFQLPVAAEDGDEGEENDSDDGSGYDRTRSGDAMDEDDDDEAEEEDDDDGDNASAMSGLQRPPGLGSAAAGGAKVAPAKKSVSRQEEKTTYAEMVWAVSVLSGFPPAFEDHTIRRTSASPRLSSPRICGIRPKRGSPRTRSRPGSSSTIPSGRPRSKKGASSRMVYSECLGILHAFLRIHPRFKVAHGSRAVPTKHIRRMII
jgi:hypothetical protein